MCLRVHLSVQLEDEKSNTEKGEVKANKTKTKAKGTGTIKRKEDDKPKDDLMKQTDSNKDLQG